MVPHISFLFIQHAADSTFLLELNLYNTESKIVQVLNNCLIFPFSVTTLKRD